MLSERALREKILELPDGLYEAGEWVEYDGHGAEHVLEIGCALLIEHDRMTVTMSGAPQINAPAMGAEAGVIGNIMSAMLCMLTYDIPLNQGVWRHLKFDLGPPGTVVNPTRPAPVSMGHTSTGFRAGKAFNDVMAQACGLSESSDMRSRVAGAPQNSVPSMLLFGDNQFGRPTVSVLLATAVGVGGGAQTVRDGQDCYAAQCMQATRMPDVEVFEAQEPLLILHRRLTQDSGGAGMFRGGLGMEEAAVVWSTNQLRGMSQSHVERVPPRGFAGGLPGSVGRIGVVKNSDARADLAAGRAPEFSHDQFELWPSIGEAVIERGDAVVMFGGGGGGLGDPLLRFPAHVGQDVHEERVSVHAAETVYGVVFGDSGEIDEAATMTRRVEMRSARIGKPATAPAPDVDASSTFDGTLNLIDSDDGQNWACGSCKAVLGPASTQWRDYATQDSVPVVAALQARNQLIKVREEGAAFVENSFACPACGFLLSVDIVEGQGAGARSAQLA